MKKKLLFFLCLFSFLIYSCHTEDLEIDEIEKSEVNLTDLKRWVELEISQTGNTFIEKKEIKWNWDNVDIYPDGLIKIHSIESKTNLSYYQLEIFFNGSDYQGILNMITPVKNDNGRYRKVVYDTEGEIIEVTFLDKIKLSKSFNLLDTQKLYEEDYLICAGIWCYDPEVGLYMSQGEVVVQFSNNTINNSNYINSINWSTVSTWLNNYYPTTSYYYGNVDTYYSGAYETGYSVSPNPCKQMDRLADNVKMINKLKDFKTKVTENKEYAAYIYQASSRGDYTFSNYIVGAPNTGQINLNLPSTDIDGLIHSHYNGSNMLSIFTSDDLKYMFQVMTNGKMRNYKDFTFTVVTGSSTYTLKIDDYQQFQEFGALYFNQSATFTLFNQMYNQRISPTKTTLENEKGFLDLISSSGLKFFKGNPILFNNWSGVKLNSTKTGLISDCN